MQAPEPKKKSNQEGAAAQTEAVGADDFFATTQTGREAAVKDFIAHMQTPREHVEAPGFAFDGDEEEDSPENSKAAEDSPEAMTPEDREMLNHFDYTPEHKYMAEFLLIQVDKVIAFGLRMFTGLGADRYRRRKTRIKGEDYESEVLAAMMKKYQLRLTLEWMFFSALVIAYAPVVEMAVSDRRKIRAQQAKEKRKEEIREIAQTVKNLD